MASQPPKFQYNPTITDIWRMMPHAQRMLQEESDSGYANEVANAANMLSQHDRQLEDYLTNLSPGGGLKYAVYEGVVGTFTYQGHNVDPSFPSSSDSFIIPITSFSLALSSPVLPTGLGVVQTQFVWNGAFGLESGPVQIYIGAIAFSTNDNQAAPWASNNGFNGRDYHSTIADFIVPPTTATVTITAVNSSLGAAALTANLDDFVILEFG